MVNQPGWPGFRLVDAMIALVSKLYSSRLGNFQHRGTITGCNVFSGSGMCLRVTILLKKQFLPYLDDDGLPWDKKRVDSACFAASFESTHGFKKWGTSSVENRHYHHVAHMFMLARLQ